MKKSLLALAVLGAFAGVASAQSSVNLYGTVDLSAKYVKNDGQARRLSLSQDGINSSQLGFRGTEDLGGGLKANFTLISGVNADTGNVSTKFFNRRATLSLLGGFGEVRLGRDYTPTFWNNTIFDAFGTNGVGNSLNVQQFAATTNVRADNSVGYFLPTNIGGVYGQVMAAASEGGSTASATGINGGRYLGGRVGFAAGPFDVAVAYGTQRIDAATANDYKTANIGASFNLGAFKLMGYYDRDTLGNRKENRYSLSGVATFGQSEIHLGYSGSKVKGLAVSPTVANNKVNQLALGYVYSLSKRTAVYSTVARLDNGGSTTSGANLAIGGGNGSPTRGGNSTAAEFGVRHFF